MSQPPLRQYQEFLLRHALSDNYVVVLPTGAGKTLIAVHLIVQALQRHPSKVVIFLAPTIPLCRQQEHVIRREAGLLLGGRPPHVVLSVNDRTTNWKRMSLQKTVIVATPQKFRNDVSDTQEGKLPWQRCSLLVMDECHHAMKRHPYSQVMEEYNLTQFKPRFLGLTASPAAHASPSKVAAKIQALCVKLCSKIVSVPMNDPMHQELMESVNIPEVQLVKVGEFDEESQFAKVATRLEDLGRRGIRELFEGDKKYATTHGETISRYSELVNILEWLANDAAPPGAANILGYFLASDTLSSFGADAALLHLRDAEASVELDPIREDLMLLATQDPPKLSALWDILKREFRQHTESHRGIIFVETRQMARDLSDLITGHAEEEISANFRPAVFLGHTNRKDPANRVTITQQKEIIEQFAKGEAVNLLVATSVAEEGIDIAACNFVIRITAQMTPIRMIQSRGRARFRDSNYYVLCATEGDVRFVEEALAGEREMLGALEKATAKTWESYTCHTTWDDPDPTIVKGLENKQPSVQERHPAFRDFDFKSVLNKWAQERWQSTSMISYSCTKAGGTTHKPLWRAVLKVTEEHVFEGKETPTRKESEQWAAYLACTFFNAVPVRR